MARKGYPSDRQDQYMLRLPDGMRDRIKAIAERNGRSMNAEIVLVLQEWVDRIEKWHEFEQQYDANPANPPMPSDWRSEASPEEAAAGMAAMNINSPDDVDRLVEKLVRQHEIQLKLGLTSALRQAKATKPSSDD